MDNQKFPYEVIDEYVRGGCSIIYRIHLKEEHAEQGQEDKMLVLKTMIPDEEDPAGEKRFYMEYEFLRAYPHQNLIEVLDYFPEWRGNPAYVMEWVKGDTWQTFWQEKNAMDQLESFFRILKQLCEVLDFIHKHQIIHRDLKPQNILITRKGQLKLIDFGIMKVQDLSLYTNRNSFMGSAYYVAPECLSGDDVSNAADIFSLGVMIYDFLTGVKPFRGHTLAETVYQRLVSTPKAPSSFKNLPKELDPFFVKILHLEPHQRHTTCDEVYRELHEILKEHLTSVKSTESVQELDICTKSHFLHTHFIEECLPELKKNKVLHLFAPAGMGKDTIVENLPRFLSFESIVRTDIHESLTQNDLIELILLQTGFIESNDEEVIHWNSTLATALPLLEWKVPVLNYQIHNSSILSAFLKILQKITQKTLILLTSVEAPSNSLLQFLNHFFFFLKRECRAPIYVVFTSDSSTEKLSRLLRPIEIPFPDVITLSDYISSQFDRASVPIEVTNQIGAISGQNLNRFLKLVQEFKQYGNLSSKNGIVSLHEDDQYQTQVVSISKTIPRVLAQFSKEQLKHLEWLALNPEGVDINVLKQLTHVDLETLSKTLKIAKENDLLDFKTGSTQGLIWKKKPVRDFLLKSMDQQERSSRCLILAQTIQTISEPYISFSPALWRIIAMLYYEGQDMTSGVKFALKYAQHCFQGAQFESIRSILNPFRSLPSVLSQHRFWFLLAIAYRSEDQLSALEYGKRALDLQQDPQTTSLMAILEFDQGNFEQSFKYTDTIFSSSDFKLLDINMNSQLLKLLLASNQISRAKTILTILEQKTKQGNDPYTENIYILAKMRILEQHPANALKYAGEIHTGLMPSKETELWKLAGYCHISLFQFAEGQKNLKQLQQAYKRARDHDHYMFMDALFFYLSFHQFKPVKKLLAGAGAQDKNLAILVRLISQLLTGDPQIHEPGYATLCLRKGHYDIATWLPLIGSLMDPRKLSPQMVDEILLLTKNNIPFLTKHQTPRFTLIKKLADEDYLDIPTYLHMAIRYAQKYDQVMECLRLASIQELLVNQGILAERIPIEIPENIQASPYTMKFHTSALY